MNTLLCFGLVLCATLAFTAAYPAVEDVGAVPVQQDTVEVVPEESLDTAESRHRHHGGHHGGWGHGGHGGWGGRGGWGHGGGYGRGGGWGYGGGYGGGFGGWGYGR